MPSISADYRDHVAPKRRGSAPRQSGVKIGNPQHTLGPPIARIVRGQRADHVMVLIDEVAPEHWWKQVLFNRRGE